MLEKSRDGLEAQSCFQRTEYLAKMVKNLIVLSNFALLLLKFLHGL